jgi:hypothetical protein
VLKATSKGLKIQAHRVTNVKNEGGSDEGEN